MTPAQDTTALADKPIGWVVKNSFGAAELFLGHERALDAFNGWGSFIGPVFEPTPSTASQTPDAVRDEIIKIVFAGITSHTDIEGFRAGKLCEKIAADVADKILSTLSTPSASAGPQAEAVMAMGRVHRLKTWPEYFNEVLSGRKPFEWRVDDRDFKLGDTLVLQEYIPHPENPGREGEYTGREITKTVSYIFSPWATNKRTVVMGFVAHPQPQQPDGRATPSLRDAHKQIPVQVWADVDVGIADAVRYLNTLSGVRTHASCQGTIGEGGAEPYRGHVMASWPAGYIEHLQVLFDITPLGENWGYLHPRGELPTTQQADGRGAVIEECAREVERTGGTMGRTIAMDVRALQQSPTTDGPFTQCEKCWQPATCKKYGCREPDGPAK